MSQHQTPLSESIEHAWELLEADDVEAALRVHDAAQRAIEQADAKTEGAVGNRERAALLALGAALAHAGGDIDGALAGYRSAHTLDPESARYLLADAELTLLECEDPGAAYDLCKRALDVASEDDEFIDAVLLAAESLLSRAEPADEAAAVELLTELDGCSLEHPALQTRAGDLQLAVGRLDQAEAAYLAAIRLDDGCADAYHGLGMVYQERDQHAPLVAAWLRVRALDLAAPPPPLAMTADALEQVAEAALAEIPERARTLLSNVPILIDDLPAPELVQEGVDPRLLGLFSGVPLPHKSHAAGQVPQLDTIHLFQRNLERACTDQAHFAEEIRITVLHETAHFFGLEDDDLALIGLD